MATYIPEPTYTNIVDAIASLGLDRDMIKITLGERGDIWPASIIGDVREQALRAGQENLRDHRRNRRAGIPYGTP